MGNSQTQIQNEQLFKQFKHDQWKRQKDLGLYEVWENIQSGQLCEAYKIDYIPNNNDLQHYRFRHYNQKADNFVQIRYIDVEKDSSLCQHAQAFVLTEFIPVKLNQMSDLTNQQGYLLLRASYRAFHTMQAFHGPFIPDQNLIGVNLNGKPKIWLNRNHSKNKADTIIEAQIWQKHMGEVSQNVKRLLEIIEQRLRQKHFPRQFRGYIFDNIMNFSKAAEYLDEYCEKNRINIPSRIDYVRHLKNEDILSIVNQYNLKKGNALSDRLNTLQSYENSKSNFAQKVDNLKGLKRDSTQNSIIYRQNLSRPPVRNSFQAIQGNLTNKPGINFNIVPRPVTANYTVFDKINPTSITNPSYNALRSLSQSKISQRRIVSPPSINFVQPSGQLRSTVSYVPAVAQKNVVSQIKIIPQMAKGPILRTVGSPVPKIINYQDMRTPLHVGNHMAFIPPHQISQFQNPTRNVMQGRLNLQINKKTDISQRKYDSHSKSIYQNINFEENAIDINKNKTQVKKSQDQTNINHDLFLDLNKRESSHDIKSSFNKQNQHVQDKIQAHLNQQELLSYLNDNYEQKLQPQRQQIDDDQTVSQPDWQNIQHQKEIQDKRQQHSQYYQQSIVYKTKLNQNQDESRISPIKQITRNNHQNFDNPHYAMFAKFAGKSSGNVKGQERQQAELELHQMPQHKAQFTQQYQPRVIRLDESGHIDSGEQNFLSSQQHSHQVQQQNQLETSQNISHLQTPGLESSQRMRHMSSKNTSINRGHNPGQSSGTLIVHESKQNLYQGVLNEQKAGKILINNIRQQSHESETQDLIQTQERILYEQEDEMTIFQREQQQSYDRQLQKYNTSQDLQHYDNEGYEKRDEYQKDNDSYQIQHKRHGNQHNSYQYEVNNSQQGHKQSQNESKYGVNPYENLHFRNESDDLYQYTPVDSVYKKSQTVQSYQTKNTLSRHQQPSGVQQIVQLQTHKDIEDYIRNKYSKIIGGNPQPASQIKKQAKGRVLKNEYNRAMTFAKPALDSERSSQNNRAERYDQINQHDIHHNFQMQENRDYFMNRIQSKYEHVLEQRQNPDMNKKQSSGQSMNDDHDFLDVGNLEKSLDKKYRGENINERASVNSPKNQNKNVKHSQTMSEQDGMNVASLQQKLLKFEERQSIQRQKSQRKLEPFQQQQYSQHNSELNFNELDNIVELMDKKIQQSQKKQQSSNTSQQKREQLNLSAFNSKYNQNKDPLQSVQLQVSISNKNISLNQIPVLKQDHMSNASNSNPHSKRDQFKRFGIDSQDFATGRDSYGLNSITRKESYTNKRSSNSSAYEIKYGNVLAPVIELDKKYENYSSNNYSTKNYQSRSYSTVIDYRIPSYIAPSDYTSEYSRKSSRRNTRNNSDVKRLADQISSKYDKYVNSDNGAGKLYQEQKPFAKKKYYDSVSYDSTKNQSSKYLPVASNISRPQGKDIQRKQSSYLNTITELYGQQNATPFKQQTSRKNSGFQASYNQNVISNLKSSQSLQHNQQNDRKLSNQNSRGGSKHDIQDNQTKSRKQSSKVSYDELRELLWK